ncbi:hypothetical protein EBR43_02985 [bacterium]|nr:hypothetical protein [bacterium]
MNELSKFIKDISNHNTPSVSYFENFLPAYKAYHKRQNVRRAVFKIVSVAAIFVVACLTFVSININNELDVPTSSGIEMSNHHTQHGKVVVFEGTVVDVTRFIKEHVKEKTETLCLKEYFRGDDVWGVYVPGDEKFRYYYQGLGKGKYIVFVVNE